jgi:hypothetical protein
MSRQPRPRSSDVAPPTTGVTPRHPARECEGVRESEIGERAEGETGDVDLREQMWGQQYAKGVRVRGKEGYIY